MKVERTTGLEGYESVTAGMVYYVWENPGYLSLEGPDRRAFLQRQTTNDINLLDSSPILTTVLTTPAARILDVLTLSEKAETLRAITLPGRGTSTLQYLRSRIFFMDKVNVEDAASEVIQIDLIGPGISILLDQFAEQFEGRPEIPVGNRRTAIDLDRFQAGLASLRNLGHRLVCPVSLAGELLEALEMAGAQRLPFETFEVLRVESGILSGGHELREEYTPLEVGLEWTVSGTKGCYTGQEVIARQITYDKVTRRLVGLRLEHPAEAGLEVLSADEDHPIGTITSAVLSPRLGPIAMAMLRRPYEEAGSMVRVGGDKETGAIVASLPFDS